MVPPKNKKISDANALEGVKSRLAEFKEKVKERIFLDNDPKTLITRLFYLAGAFLLGRGSWLFGCYPFGIALLCSAKEHLWLIWIALTASSFFVKGVSPFLMIAVYTLLLALRTGGKTLFFARKNDKSLSEGLGMRTVIAVVISFIPGLYTCIVDSFSLHALFSLLFYLISGGVLTFLYSPAFSGMIVKRFAKKAAAAALMFSLVYSLTSVDLFGFDPALTVAALLCFVCAASQDYLSVGVLGLILGAACGKENVLVLGLLGLVSSAFHKYNRRLAPSIGVLAGFAYAYFSRGNTAFLYVLPDLFAAALLYLPFDLYRSKKALLSKNKKNDSAEAQNEEVLEKHLAEIRDSLFSLSKEIRSPDKRGAELFFSEFTDRICAECPQKCFQNDEQKRKAAAELLAFSYLSPNGDAFKSIASACPEKESFSTRLHSDYALYRRTLHKDDRAGIYATAYRDLERILRDVRQAKAADEAVDPDESAKLQAILKKQGVAFSSVEVRGSAGLSCRIFDVNEEEILRYAPSLTKTIEEGCARRITPLCVKEEKGRFVLHFSFLPLLEAHCSIATSPKEGEHENGDSALFFKIGRYFFSALLDGMGSGREAAQISDICRKFLSELFAMRVSFDTALEVINSFLVGLEREISTTLDLMILDLFTGKCRFVKCGACPSLVLRGEDLFKIACATLPLGSAPRIQYESVTAKLRAGDRVILVSDGICEEPEEAPWLIDLQSKKLSGDAQELSSAILDRAQTENTKADDRTVIVVDLQNAEDAEKM